MLISVLMRTGLERLHLADGWTSCTSHSEQKHPVVEQLEPWELGADEGETDDITEGDSGGDDSVQAGLDGLLAEMKEEAEREMQKELDGIDSAVADFNEAVATAMCNSPSTATVTPVKETIVTGGDYVLTGSDLEDTDLELTDEEDFGGEVTQGEARQNDVLNT